jgi:hypothetical protein
MSWEKDYDSQYPCPCGNSTYTKESYSDDWGRNDESWSMNCQICSQGYTLYTNYYYESGMSVSSNFWVTKDELFTYEQTSESVMNQKMETLDFAKNRYLAQWKDLFVSCKSKKAIWEKLSKSIGLSISLSTFYSHAKNVDEYLADCFNIGSLSRILNVIGANDEELNQMLGELVNKETELRSLRSNLIKQGRK